MIEGAAERLEVSRTVPASAADLYAILTDPRGHVAIDASGMLMSADGPVVSAVGDRFTVHMDRESLGDLPMGRYAVDVVITALEPERLVEWTIEGTVRPFIRHRYGYLLEPAEGATATGNAGATRVTSYCDWSQARADLKAAGLFPVVQASSLKATLGILARVVLAGGLPAR